MLSLDFHCYCIKFCQKLGDNRVETIRKIQTAFSDAMGVTEIKEWCNRFKDGHISVDSEPHSGQSSKSQNVQVVAKVNAVVIKDRRVTIQQIVEEAISTFSAHSILSEDLAITTMLQHIPRT